MCVQCGVVYESKTDPKGGGKCHTHIHYTHIFMCVYIYNVPRDCTSTKARPGAKSSTFILMDTARE